MTTPPGWKANWEYHGRWTEKKLRPGLWKFRFKATKHRKAKSWGSIGKGTKGAWQIKGRQYIHKTGIGTYQTTFYGTKKPLKFHIKKPR